MLDEDADGWRELTLSWLDLCIAILRGPSRSDIDAGTVMQTPRDNRSLAGVTVNRNPELPERWPFGHTNLLFAIARLSRLSRQFFPAHAGKLRSFLARQ